MASQSLSPERLWKVCRVLDYGVLAGISVVLFSGSNSSSQSICLRKTEIGHVTKLRAPSLRFVRREAVDGRECPNSPPMSGTHA